MPCWMPTKGSLSKAQKGRRKPDDLIFLVAFIFNYHLITACVCLPLISYYQFYRIVIMVIISSCFCFIAVGFHSSNLTGANFTNASMQYLKCFYNNTLTGAIFTDADLTQQTQIYCVGYGYEMAFSKENSEAMQRGGAHMPSTNGYMYCVCGKHTQQIFFVCLRFYEALKSF